MDHKHVSRARQKMFYQMLLLFCAVAVVIGLASFVPHTRASAVVQTGGYLQGFAWANQGDPKGGVGYICFNDAVYCPTAAVYISSDNRTLTGYAWSDNIGWISFGPNIVGCGGPNAYTDQNFNLTGWAKAVNATQAQSGGWDGCIALSSVGLSGAQNPNGTVWGVKLDGSHTYAWGSETVGWVDFAGVIGAFTTQIGGDNSLVLNANPIHVLKNNSVSLTFTPPVTESWCRITGSDGSVPYPQTNNPSGLQTASAVVTKATTYTLLCQQPDTSQHTGNVTVTLLATFKEI